MKRREFIKAAALGGAGLTIGSCAGLAGKRNSKAAGRPNLVFIFADQLGYARCGYAGDGKGRTPNIDGLASQGVSFCNAVSKMPVCAVF